jgi:hypothetical protein
MQAGSVLGSSSPDVITILTITNTSHNTIEVASVGYTFGKHRGKLGKLLKREKREERGQTK